MYLVIFHIISTLSSMIIGYYLIVFSRRTLESQKYLSLALAGLYICSAISGIFLNLETFSPFHILAIITLSTTPVAVYRYFNGKFKAFNRSMLYNFIGLNIAFAGALAPNRTLGYRFWKLGLHLDTTMALNSFYVFLSAMMVIATVVIIRSFKNPQLY
jgi:uncharacterized membrane protein